MELVPIKPIEILELDAITYKYLQNISNFSLEKLDEIIELLKEQKFDAIKIPVGAYETEEYEIAFRSPSALRIKKVLTNRKPWEETENVTETFKKDNPDLKDAFV